MFPAIPVLQVSADPTDSDISPAELRTPELPSQTLVQSTQDLQPVLPTDSTPIKRSCSTMQPYTTNTRCRDTTFNAMGKEIMGYLVGPMPVELFLEKFLSPSAILDYQPLTSFSDGAFETTLSAAHETRAYEPFVGTFTYDIKTVISQSDSRCRSTPCHLLLLVYRLSTPTAMRT
jgi:hypothetical protein